MASVACSTSDVQKLTWGEIAAGAGTIGRELRAAGLNPDVVLVQIGDGALVTGIASWLKATSPGVHVVGVTARGAPAMAQSLETGRPVERQADTIADGLSITRPVSGALEQVAAAVDEILPVSDDTMLAAMRLLAERAGVLAEPSGAPRTICWSRCSRCRTISRPGGSGSIPPSTRCGATHGSNGWWKEPRRHRG